MTALFVAAKFLMSVFLNNICNINWNAMQIEMHDVNYAFDMLINTVNGLLQLGYGSFLVHSYWDIPIFCFTSAIRHSCSSICLDFL